jgi:hypothetical protein
MSGSFDKLVDAAFQGGAAVELAGEPPDALKGVSAADADHLEAAFGISTISEMAGNRFFRAATVVAAGASGKPAFDPGPPAEWEALFEAAPLGTYESRPDLFRLDFGPVYYRGRLDGTARILIVGQDPSVNEILAQRVFVGQSGQRLQGFLAKLGITRSYLMLNTFLYSIFGQFDGENATLSAQDPILGYRNSLFDAALEANPLEAVICVGSAARHAVDVWPGSAGLHRTNMIHPAFPDTSQLLVNWNQALADLQPVVQPDDGAAPGAPYGAAFTAGDVIAIPRRDLPFGVPSWHGKGDHARRSGNEIIEWHSNEV